MENKEYNTVEDFVFNKSFQEWVLNNDPYSTKFWLNWISYNPEKATIISYSKAIVDSLPVNTRKASEVEINDQIERIISNTKNRPVVLSGDLITPRPMARVLVISPKIWLSIIAIFILVVASTWYLVTAHSKYPDPYKSFAAGYAQSLMELTNHSDTVQLIPLGDGTVVSLYSKSKLSYTSRELADKREVFLTGKALFNIRTDAAKPFFVYTQGTITKATGTSFEIAMFPDKKTTVTVGKGHVLVYRRKEIDEGGSKLYGMVGTLVTPNQQLLFNEANNALYRTLIKNPVPIYKTPVPFAFVSKPLADIFGVLQQSYSIPIFFDREITSSCLISVDLSNQSFYDQLRLVCKSVHASYEVVDGSVVIAEPRCQ